MKGRNQKEQKKIEDGMAIVSELTEGRGNKKL